MAKTKALPAGVEIRYIIKLEAKRRRFRGFVYVGSVQEDNRGQVVKFRQVQRKEDAFPYAKFRAEDIAARLKACRYFPEIEAVTVASKKAA